MSEIVNEGEGDDDLVREGSYDSFLREAARVTDVAPRAV